MLRVNDEVTIPDSELEISAVRSQGAGGQNVNKVATAVHLRFDIPASSLPDRVKSRLMALRDRRISKDGVLIIKSQSQRSQGRNRDEALDRLKALILDAMREKKRRRKTKPTGASRKKRLETKAKRGRLKELRRKIDF